MKYILYLKNILVVVLIVFIVSVGCQNNNSEIEKITSGKATSEAEEQKNCSSKVKVQQLCPKTCDKCKKPQVGGILAFSKKKKKKSKYEAKVKI